MSENRTSERGAALLVALLVSVIMVGLVAAYLTISTMQHQASANSLKRFQALQVAESGVDIVIYEMENNTTFDPEGDGTETRTGNVAGGTYTVVATQDAVDPDLWVLQSTGQVMTGPNVEAARGVDVAVRGSFGGGGFAGVFSDRDFLIGSNAYVDSYDSDLGSYASQITGSFEGQDYANQNGGIGSNGNIELDSNAKVFGTATAGVGNSTTLGGNSTVSGSTAPMTSPVVFDPVTIPASIDALPPVVLDQGSNTSDSIPPGNHHFSLLATGSNSTITITGPATIVVDDLRTDSNSNIIVDATNGPVEFYGKGDFDLDSNSSLSSTTNNPADIKVFLATDNINPDGTEDETRGHVNINSNGALFAVIYAPKAYANLDSNGGFFGSIAAGVVSVNSNFGIHFDEALGAGGGGGPLNFTVISWREFVPTVGVQ